jgi:hypothetical protein
MEEKERVQINKGDLGFLFISFTLYCISLWIYWSIKSVQIGKEQWKNQQNVCAKGWTCDNSFKYLHIIWTTNS